MVRFVAALSVLFLVALSAFVAAGDAKKEPAPKDTDWKALFDGKSLKNWKATNFGGEGEIVVENGGIVIDRGSEMSGITYTGADFPKTHFEVAFEAKRTQGLDFFCTTTFPVGDDHCSLVVGGWAGSVVGLSSIDGKDASRNETKKEMSFDNNKWYRVRIRVTPDRIAAWIDDAPVVNFPTKGRKISIRPECDLSRPFGICTWSSSSVVRDIKLRTIRE